MASLSGLPALDINPVGLGAENSSALSNSQIAYQNAQQAQAITPLETEQQEAVIPLVTKEKQQQSQLQTLNYGNQLMAQAAKDALAADPASAPEIWDQEMKAAADAGFPAATQHIGHFRRDLATQVSEAYGGQSGSQLAKATGAGEQSPGSPDPQMLDMQLSQMPPQQLQQAMKNQNIAKASWDKLTTNGSATAKDLLAEVKYLQQNGIDVTKVLPGYDFTKTDPASFATNYAAVAALMNKTQPFRDALNRAAERQQFGLGVPIPRNIVKTDAGIYEVNPFAPSGTPAIPLATTPSYDRTYATDAQGRPIVFDKHTGQSMVSNPVDQNAPQGVPLTEFASRMTQAENAGGNRSAQNPNSTAAGNGQFINSTWLNTVKQARPELAGLSNQNLLLLRNDPGFAAEMTAESARANGSQLQQAGFPVTTATLGLAHRFGAGDAAKIMQAPPGTPMAKILSPQVLAANPGLAAQTTSGYLSGLAQQVGNDPVDLGTGAGGAQVRTLSPEQKALQEKQLPEQFEKAQESFTSATNLQYQLKTMQDQLAQLGTSGFLAPGTGAGARTQLAKKLNSLATAYLGVNANDTKNLPFDPNKIASAEDIQKGTTRLGFDLARQLGSREAMMIVQQAVGAVPGIENTPRGAKLIFGALNTAAQRQVDYYAYLTDWAQTHPNTLGADVAFNKAYPPSYYSNKALLAGVPADRLDYLKQNPKTASQFDAYYGNGLSKVILGQK